MSTSFQSIDVTSEWWLIDHSHAMNISGFPINRCHQRVVTPKDDDIGGIYTGFQSIDVTSEWWLFQWGCCKKLLRCFQSIDVTSEWWLETMEKWGGGFCSFQSIDVTSEWWLLECADESGLLTEQFPINRCHQRVVTSFVWWYTRKDIHRFQSIDVTSEWWHDLELFSGNITHSFQSIDVTSEWWHVRERLVHLSGSRVSNQ